MYIVNKQTYIMSIYYYQTGSLIGTMYDCEKYLFKLSLSCEWKLVKDKPNGSFTFSCKVMSHIMLMHILQLKKYTNIISYICFVFYANQVCAIKLK